MELRCKCSRGERVSPQRQRRGDHVSSVVVIIVMLVVPVRATNEAK